MKIGIDTAQILRIKAAAEKNPKFFKRIFTDREIEYFSVPRIKWESVAGNFAAKEAFLKYLGTGIRDTSFKTVELLHGETGEPMLYWNGKRMNVSVSISHDGGMAVAAVCGEELKKSSHSEYIRSLLPKRADDANKGDCGKIFILAGSKGMTGAAYFSAMGALRVGAGLVTVGTAASEQGVLATKLDEAMTKGFAVQKNGIGLLDKEKILDMANDADAFVIGPGMGREAETAELIRYLVKKAKTPTVIDADGLNAISGNIDILNGRQGETVLTPHEGEMAKLTRKTAEEIRANRQKSATELFDRTGAVVLLKGRHTVVAGKNCFINPTGNAGMATGGSGDVLSGVIGGLIAQGLNCYDAAVLGAYIHGLSGDIAKADKGEMGLIASDIVKNLPYALKELSGE